MTLEKRTLGASDIEVTPIGLGCWQFSQGTGLAGKFWPTLPGADMTSIVKAALDGGISWFDTAEVYGWGKSERALADALKANGKAPGDVVVATKWYPLLRPPRSIEATIDDRLACLGGFPIDLHQIHFPHASLGSDRQKMDALANLVDAGKVRSVGVSNYGARGMVTCHEALKARGLPLVSNQVEYSLLKRGIETNGTLATAKDLGVTIIAYSPLAQGILSGKFHDKPELLSNLSVMRRLKPEFWSSRLRKSEPVVRALQEIAEARQATPSQVALRWLTQFHGETVVAIPGATKVHHAEDNAGALTFSLNSDELDRLDRVSQPFKHGGLF